LLQVWFGTLIGLVICIVIGCGLIGAFYGLRKDRWSNIELIWEGVFSFVASLIIAIMGAALLRISKLQIKWRVKLARALEAKDNRAERAGKRFKKWCEKYAMFMLPFVTILREGLEAVVFIGGVSLGIPAASIPLAVVTGLAGGVVVGCIIYRGGNAAPLQVFLIVSTCFLYLVAAGLFSRGIWYLENNTWNHQTGGDSSETGSGPGSYDIRESVWHVNCCNPDLGGGGGWGIFNAILGWQNSATYGSVIGYNLFWLFVTLTFCAMSWRERKGSWPFMKARKANAVPANSLEKETSASQSDVRPEDVVGESSTGDGPNPVVKTVQV
jgi:high-affinity iron transporter